MIFIKKNRTKYPVINTPISKLYLVHLQEKYPKGFYLNDGKKITLITSNTKRKNQTINNKGKNKTIELGKHQHSGTKRE
jgi:hypothetical protein